MRQVLVVAMLLLAPTALSWNQEGGGGHHSGEADLPTHPLDVVSTFRLADDGWSTGVLAAGTFVDTPHGPTTILTSAVASLNFANVVQDCRMVRILDPGAGLATNVLETFPCENGGKMLAYDRVRDQLIVAIEEQDTARMLRFLDALDGQEAWATGPSVQVEVPSGGADRGDWGITGSALDDASTRLYVFATHEGIFHNVLEAIDLESRASVWQTSITYESYFVQLTGGEQGLPLDSLQQGATRHRVTLTDSGIVLTGAGGHLYGSAGPNIFGSAAWLDFDGNRIGAWYPTAQDAATGTTSPVGTAFGGDSVSEFAAAQDQRAVLLLNDELLFIDPEVPTPQTIHVDRPAFPGVTFAGPAWVGDHVIAPARDGAYVYESSSGDASWWPGHNGGSIDAVIATTRADALVALSHGEDLDAPGSLVHVDLRTARTVHALPLPELGANLKLLPLDSSDGVLVWSRLTPLAAFLGEADPSLLPTVTPDRAYPAINEAVELEVAATGAERILVGWGDGARQQTGAEATVSHDYAEPGLFTVRVTAVYPDSRTGTVERQVFVGQQPPARNVLETMFAKENQDLTFGILGVGLVALGAVVTMLARRRGRSRIAAGLRDLTAIRERAGSEPLDALRDLQRWHGRQEDRLLHGRLTEDQFRVLENRGGLLLRRLGQRVLGPVTPDLSAGLRGQLEAAMLDGFVDSAELADLRAALRGEKLPAAKRRQIDALLEAWD